MGNSVTLKTVAGAAGVSKRIDELEFRDAAKALVGTNQSGVILKGYGGNIEVSHDVARPGGGTEF